MNLPFWDLEDGGPLLSAPLLSIPVVTLCVDFYPTYLFLTILEEVLHEGSVPAAIFCLDIQVFPSIH